MSITKRHLEPILRKRFQQARSVYLFGPRQSGKTTLARHCFPEIPYVSLEDPDARDYAKSDPKGFLNSFKTAAIIDEPQHFPDLFSYLQSEIDIRQKKFILTSSQNFLLSSSISQSLAGRLSILNLMPMTMSERFKKPYSDLWQKIKQDEPSSPITELYEQLLCGGYPEPVTHKASREFWYSDYTRTYLERDVRQVINVQDMGTFQRFLKLSAGRSGQILNRSSLSNDSGISETTCQRWLSILEQSGLIFYSAPYHNNFNKRITKSPKIYFWDTGLLCHLLGIRTTEHLHQHPLYGAIIETHVVAEIRKNFLNAGIEEPTFHWRDQQGEEIDLILEHNGVPIPIEIKAGQTIASSMLKSLEKWQITTQHAQNVLFYGGATSQKRNNTHIQPIGVL